MRKQFLLLLFIVCVLLCSIEAKKGKKKSQKIERPRNIDPHLYCESCRAITLEMLKILKGSKSEIEISDALSNVCDSSRYYTYNSPPPDMVRGCQAFFAAGHDEALEDLLLKRKSDEGVAEELCFKITKACENLPIPQEKKGLDVTINGVHSTHKIETVDSADKKVELNEL